jgi:2-dehydropantoate 2-reductase
MILVVGAGAVGTILTAYLAAAGREPVAIYTRDKDRAAMGALDRIRVDAADGSLLLDAPRPALRDTLDLRDVDYVLLGVKFPQLDAVLDQLGPIPPHCTLVSTLNGVAALRRIREHLPHARLAPMTVMFNGQLLGPLHAKITTKAQVHVGSHDARLLGAFKGSGLQCKRASGDAAAWGKLLINLANAICALTHTTFRDLLTQPDLRAVYVAVLDEATTTLRRAGVDYKLPMPIPYALYRSLLAGRTRLPWWFAQIRNGLKDGAYPSMVADVDAGKPTEIDQLNGEIVALGRAHGLPTPVNGTIAALVQALPSVPPIPYLTPAALRAKLSLTGG